MEDLREKRITGSDRRIAACLKRALFVALIVFATIQVPFIYRRYKFSQLAENISQLKQAPVEQASPADGAFREYRGVVHVHTNLGGHSTGSFDELTAAAETSRLDFVILTEHWSDRLDTAAHTLNGTYGTTLFVGGNEIDTANPGDRLLTIPGPGDADPRRLSTTDIIDSLDARDGLSVVTYPEKFRSWQSDFDSIEVFNLYTVAKDTNPFTAFFDIVWSFSSYPELVLTHYFVRPAGNLRTFDELAAKRRISLIAGSDAHSNIGFHLLGDDSGNRSINFKIDDYATIFGLIRQHVLLPSNRPLDQKDILLSLKQGHSFIGIDALADSTGFRFSSGSQDADPVIMGDELDVELARTVGLTSRSPHPGRFVVYRNGEIYLQNDHTTQISFSPTDPGAYRIEVYLDQLGPPFDKTPWIISNPIFVR